MKFSRFALEHHEYIRILRDELDTFLETPKTAMYDFHEISHDTVFLLNVFGLGIDVCHDCSEKLYESWLENNNNSSNLVTRLQFFDLLSRVEYGMFWNRNQTTYRTIEFYKKRKRQMEHKMSLMKKDDE